ncbi:MAG: AAA family ATPase [Chloroflexota bacterium]
MRRRRIGKFAVPLEQLRRYADLEQFPFETTATLMPLDGTIGQARAMASLQFGVGIEAPGYNVYVAGDATTRRSPTAEGFLRSIAKGRPVPPDWVYVYNFEDSYRPVAVCLPAGVGEQLAADMTRFVEQVKVELPRAFETEDYEERKREETKDIEQRREDLSNLLQEEAKKEGFAIQTTAMGMMTLPMVDGQAMSREAFEALPEEQKKEIQERGQRLQANLSQIMGRARALEKEATERMRQFNQAIAEATVSGLLDDLQERYGAEREVAQYLSGVKADIIERIDELRSTEKEAVTLPGVGKVTPEDQFERYAVNVFVSNKGAEGAPVIVENNPTYYNLIGRIDYRARLGGMTTDFTMIKPGALHRANGGYLIVQAYDLLTSPQSWEALKRTLRAREVRIENLGELLSPVPTATLKPEPIPLDLKVVLIGQPYIYYLLYNQDEDFRKLFKVRADFADQMDRTADNEYSYAQFIASQSTERGLRHFDRGGVAKVVEYGSRLEEHQNKLSTRFLAIADLLAEADYWAGLDNASLVQAEHVQKAIDEKLYRAGQVEERIRDLIVEGTVIISTEGAVPGQINGLSVSQMGDHSFGRPSRITARTAFGQNGVVAIERETRMSGRIHSKGVLVLTGYLSGKYAQDKPLAVSATVTFEQLYDEVDGDSASSTELYALLSSLSGLPLRQDIAVTGSVNQRGEVQPIGGVNQKIEGFFDVCKTVGLSGDQGVMIPQSNVKHLMLREDVVQAVREGRFHIYAVKTIDEGIEILTGTPAGAARPDGSYPGGTVNYLVDQHLREFVSRFREFGAAIVAERHLSRPERNAA